MNPTVREIQTLADLLEAAQATEDVDGLFADLRTWVDLGIELNAQPRHLKFNPKFIWKDDGDRGISGVRINIGGGA